MNTINHLVRFHNGILNKKSLGVIDQFDLDNFKDVSVLFSIIDGYGRNRFKKAEFYIENRKEIDDRLTQIKLEYSDYLSKFTPELLNENFFGEGEHLYSFPIDFYCYLINETKI